MIYIGIPSNIKSIMSAAFTLKQYAGSPYSPYGDYLEQDYTKFPHCLVNFTNINWGYNEKKFNVEKFIKSGENFKSLTSSSFLSSVKVQQYNDYDYLKSDKALPLELIVTLPTPMIFSSTPINQMVIEGVLTKNNQASKITLMRIAIVDEDEYPILYPPDMKTTCTLSIPIIWDDVIDSENEI